jgi:hypothetical protein
MQIESSSIVDPDLGFLYNSMGVTQGCAMPTLKLDLNPSLRTANGEIPRVCTTLVNLLFWVEKPID